jgi:hypothetical protein
LGVTIFYICVFLSGSEHTFAVVWPYLPNMTYYGDNAPQLAGSVIAIAVIAYIVFALRVYTRVRSGAFGVDDWCMCAATVGKPLPAGIVQGY